MPGEIRELNIKITVDGKEGITTLQLTGEQLKNLTKTVNSLGAQNSTVYAQLTQALSQYTGVTDESVQSVANWINTQGLGVGAIQQVISQLEKESKELSISSAAYRKNQLAIENLRKGMQRAVVMNQQLANKTALTSRQLIAQNKHFNSGKMGINQLGFALGDASVFAVSFRMGILGIGNNIPFIVQGMMELKKSAEDTGKTFSKVLTQAIMGPAGVILAVNLFLTVMTILLPMLTKAKEKTKELADETERYASKVKNLAVTEIESEKQRLELEKTKLKAEIKAAKVKVSKPSGTTGILGQPILTQTKEEKENLENLNLKLEETVTNLKAINKQLPITKEAFKNAFKDDYKSINDVSDKLKALNKGFTGADSDKERAFIKARINFLQKENKRMRGEKLKDETVTIKKQKDLQAELALELKAGREKELAELQKWYDERLKIAKGNAALLAQLGTARLLREKEILKKYTDASINAELQTYDAKVKYSELKGKIDKELVQEEINYIKSLLSAEEINVTRRNELTEKLLGLQNKLMGASIDAEIKIYDAKIKYSELTGELDGGLIQDEIDYINNVLSRGNIKLDERNRLLEKRLSLLKKMQGTVTTQGTLVKSLGGVWRLAGNMVASAMSRGINLFGQANSLLQIFINGLGRAIIQALALRAVLAILDLIGLGPAKKALKTIIPVGAGLPFAAGGIVTKPTFAMIGEGREPEGVFPLSKLQQFISLQPARNNTNINLRITQDPVELTGDGMKLRAVLKKVETYINTKK